MIKVTLLVVALCGGVFLNQANAQTTCPVTEIVKQGDPGKCFTRGQLNATKCQDYCKQFNPNAVGECSMAAEHADCKPSCVCKYPCYNGGNAGDPHYWTWDGVKFDWMGLKKHYLLKPCEDYDNFPNFEIRQSNRPYSGPISVINSVELVIPEWERVVEVTVPAAPGGTFTFTVNGNKRDLPYEYPADESCNSEYLKVDYVDDKKTQVLIQTSFGLRITVAWAYHSIDIPKHPELEKKACGLLGSPNGNPGDDCKLSTGEKCTHQPGFDPQGVFNVPLGNSWTVPGFGAWAADCFPEEEQKEHDKLINNIPPETKKRVEQLCKDNIGNPEVQDCAKKLGRLPPTVEECAFDAQLLPTEEAQKEFIKTALQTWAVGCKKDIPFVDTGKGECCKKNVGMKNLAPVYRLYSPILDNHHYTMAVPEVISATVTHPGKYVLENAVGFAAATPEDCNCGAGTILKPVYRHFKQISATKADHFFTTCPIESANAVAKLGYVKEGIAFYCVEKTEGACGATVPLFRVLRGHDHFYTSDEPEYKRVIAGGSNDEDMLCFIWPNPPAVTQK